MFRTASGKTCGCGRWGKTAQRREVTVEDLWPHKSFLVLKFQGIETISDAEPLVGAELQLPRSERAQLEPGWTYLSDLIGCTVFDGQREIGEIEDVQFGAGEAPLLVVRSKEQRKRSCPTRFPSPRRIWRRWIWSGSRFG